MGLFFHIIDFRSVSIEEAFDRLLCCFFLKHCVSYFPSVEKAIVFDFVTRCLGSSVVVSHPAASSSERSPDIEL